MTDRETDQLKEIDAIGVLMASVDTTATIPPDTINNIGQLINDVTAQLLAD